MRSNPGSIEHSQTRDTSALHCLAGANRPQLASRPNRGYAAPQPPVPTAFGAASLNRTDNTPTPSKLPSNGAATFLGPQGLRAGWSLLLFTVILAASLALLGINPAIFFLRSSATSQTAPEQPLALILQFEAIVFASVLLASLVLARVEHRPLRAFGLGLTPRASRQFATGLLAGLLLLALLIATLRALHLIAFQSVLLGPSAALRYGLLWLLAFFFVALAEEFLLRGFLQFTLARALTGLASILRLPASLAPTAGFWTAATLLSLLFGLGHRTNPGESPVGLLSAALIGLTFCLSLYRTGSLWWAIGFHTAWDWAQSFLFGTPDSGALVQHHLLASHPQGPLLWSGGLTGPEGSLLMLPTTVLIAAAILLTTRPRPRPTQP